MKDPNKLRQILKAEDKNWNVSFKKSQAFRKGMAAIAMAEYQTEETKDACDAISYALHCGILE